MMKLIETYPHESIVFLTFLLSFVVQQASPAIVKRYPGTDRFFRSFLEAAPNWIAAVLSLILGRRISDPAVPSAPVVCPHCQSNLNPPPPKSKGGNLSLGDKATMVLLALGCATWVAGCGDLSKFRETARSALEANRDALAVSEPCLAEQHDRDLAACHGDPKCETTVRSHWAPIADLFDKAREYWCAIDSDGCAKGRAAR